MTAVSQWSPCLLHVSQTCEFYSSKANQRLRFSLLSFILTDLLGNSTLLHGFKRSWFVICDWWISIRFVCFSVSRFVACDRNYDWRQRKTQLWEWLLNFRVRMFVKSTVKSQMQSVRLLDQWGSMDSWLSVLVYFWFSYNAIFLSSVNQLSLSPFTLVERQ